VLAAPPQYMIRAAPVLTVKQQEGGLSTPKLPSHCRSHRDQPKGGIDIHLIDPFPLLRLVFRLLPSAVLESLRPLPFHHVGRSARAVPRGSLGAPSHWRRFPDGGSQQMVFGEPAFSALRTSLGLASSPFANSRFLISPVTLPGFSCQQPLCC
jgi:hypothetical protein